jgi:RND family efflux transporter MFP subunit
MNGNENEIALQDAAIGAASFDIEIALLQLEDLQRGNPFDVLEANARIREAELAIEQVQAGPTEAEITSAEIAIQRAEVQLQEAEIALAHTELVAAGEGTIFSVDAKLGQAVSPGVWVIEVTDTTPLWVTVQVDETDVDLIRPGMTAAIQLDALTDVELKATIDRIALLGEEVDGVMYFETRLRLDAADPRVRVGMTAEAFIELDTTEQLAIVPNEYIRIEDNQAYVDVLNADNTTTAVRIALGVQGLDTTEVRSGIAPGDVLIQGVSA